MKVQFPISIYHCIVITVGALLLATASLAQSPKQNRAGNLAQSPNWATAVNNASEAPGGEPGAKFISYNQPALNDDGIMVFRARSRISTSDPLTSGIYRLDLFGGSIEKLAIRGDVVPDPNNTVVSGSLATFNDFPSTPRIDPGSGLIASRGQHMPVWSYLIDGEETRIGTAGIFAYQGTTGITGASLLGAAVEPDGVTLTFPWFSVPGTVFGTRFEQFPGAPAVSDGRFIVYKGNYTDLNDGLGRTGIYYRDVVAGDPQPFTGLIAYSDTIIPNQPKGGIVEFGSTAPPSAAEGWVYFTGLDIEEAPTLGGIYRAPIAPTPALQVVAGIGQQVPGEPPGPENTFITFGEALSVSSDGNRLLFWSAWGSETFEKLLICPEDGRPEVIAFCNEQHPDGFVIEVPVNQGFFVFDGPTDTIYRIARTGEDGIDDFLFHNFSGRVPGAGEEEDDEELARWRSGATGALSSAADAPSLAAIKAARNGTSGIYLREGLGFQLPLRTIAEVDTTPGTDLDPDAPAGSVVSEVGVERDGFRNDRLAINAAMLFEDPLDPEESDGWAGIYYADLAPDLIFQDGFEEPVTTN